MEVQLADRLQKLPPYLFAALRKKIAAKKTEGIDVITLGIGDPDQPTPDPIIDELIKTVKDKKDINRHRYGCDVPTDEFPAAIKGYYKSRYNVNLADDQVCATLGSKDAIAKLAMGIMNPGDLGIAPIPGYPTYNIGNVFSSAVTHYVPLRKQNDWLLDFDEIPYEVKQQAKILWINYPNNPTTAVAPMDFFERAVEFGRQNNILIAHDSAYSENTYDGYKAPSILEVDGADEVAVEFFSLSKAFNMTGWRSGFLTGNTSAVNALKTVKDNIDNGSLRAIQFASAKALEMADKIFPEVNEVYKRRRDMVCDTLEKAGWPVKKPKATIYIWAPVPDKYNNDSGKFSEELLDKAGVVVTPGRGYGEGGEGFYRISLTYPDQVLEEALGRIMAMSK